jgi:hypothetical protein
MRIESNIITDPLLFGIKSNALADRKTLNHMHRCAPGNFHPQHRILELENALPTKHFDQRFSQCIQQTIGDGRRQQRASLLADHP